MSDGSVCRWASSIDRGQMPKGGGYSLRNVERRPVLCSFKRIEGGLSKKSLKKNPSTPSSRPRLHCPVISDMTVFIFRFALWLQFFRILIPSGVKNGKSIFSWDLMRWYSCKNLHH